MRIFTSACLAFFLVTLSAGCLKADEVPVKVSVRKALNSTVNLVVQFTNTSDKALPVQSI
jgi:hypothetical protein